MPEAVALSQPADEELELVRDRLRLQAEQVSQLMDMVDRCTRAGGDPELAEQRMRLVERQLWKHHAYLRQLQAKSAA